MLVHPFRVMDVSTSMATGAQHVIPATSANEREVAGYYIIAVSGQQLVRILPKEFGSSTPPAAPLVLQFPCFRQLREIQDCGTLCLRAFPGSASE